MRYVFEDYSLDTGRRELRRGTNSIALEPRVFDLLAHLVRNRERVVSKDDMIAAGLGRAHSLRIDAHYLHQWRALRDRRQR
jgi:DNA-binding winged helix-turn-helix (wHTH) protein